LAWRAKKKERMKTKNKTLENWGSLGANRAAVGVRISILLLCGLAGKMRMGRENSLELTG
jgi:hypothetical protein